MKVSIPELEVGIEKREVLKMSIEILYSTQLRLVKYKFQFVEFRKYDYIPFVDQVNN